MNDAIFFFLKKKNNFVWVSNGTKSLYNLYESFGVVLAFIYKLGNYRNLYWTSFSYSSHKKVRKSKTYT